MPSEPKILRLVIIKRGWEVEFDLALFLALRLVARGVGFGQCYGFNSSQSLGQGGWELDNVLASFVASHWVI